MNDAQCPSLAEAERNNDLPITPDGHLALLAEVNRIVALAPGKHVAMGLSLGGNYAAHAAMATVPGGTAPLYERVLIMAPFFQSLGVGPLLTPLHSMGLGALTVDWGVGCDEERRLGRRGYCTMLVDNIRAARDMGGRLFDSPPLRFPTGSHVAYMLVEQVCSAAPRCLPAARFSACARLRSALPCTTGAESRIAPAAVSCTR